MPIMIDLASPSAAPRPDWVANSFPASVRGDQDYLGLCLDTLESVIFQDSVLPELRPKPLDPVGESRHRLGVFVMARIVVLAIPSQVPDQGIVRSQDSTERSWFKVSRFCYMLMKYSCDRRGGQG